MEEDRLLHRAKPGESRAGPVRRRLPVVERITAVEERRDESRRGRHECLRHTMTARVAILCDFREEGWTSMDLVAEMLAARLPYTTRIQPAMKRRFPAFNAD